MDLKRALQRPCGITERWREFQEMVSRGEKLVSIGTLALSLPGTRRLAALLYHALCHNVLPSHRFQTNESTNHVSKPLKPRVKINLPFYWIILGTQSQWQEPNTTLSPWPTKCPLCPMCSDSLFQLTCITSSSRKLFPNSPQPQAPFSLCMSNITQPFNIQNPLSSMEPFCITQEKTNLFLLCKPTTLWAST